jgi:hypothetical protein
VPERHALTLPHDHDRSPGVGEDTLRDAAQQRLAEDAEATGADDDQVDIAVVGDAADLCDRVAEGELEAHVDVVLLGDRLRVAKRFVFLGGRKIVGPVLRVPGHRPERIRGRHVQDRHLGVLLCCELDAGSDRLVGGARAVGCDQELAHGLSFRANCRRSEGRRHRWPAPCALRVFRDYHSVQASNRRAPRGRRCGRRGVRGRRRRRGVQRLRRLSHDVPLRAHGHAGSPPSKNSRSRRSRSRGERTSRSRRSSHCTSSTATRRVREVSKCARSASCG